MKDKTREIDPDRENFVSQKGVRCEQGRERFSGFLPKNWKSRVLGSDRSHWDALCLPAQRRRWAAPRRRQDWGPEGHGGLGSQGDEASGRREAARGREGAL